MECLHVGKSNDPIEKGLLIQDQGGRIVYANGSIIRRLGNENFVQAVGTREHALSVISLHSEMIVILRLTPKRKKMIAMQYGMRDLELMKMYLL